MAPRIRTFDSSQFHAHCSDFLNIAADIPGEYWRESHFLADLPDKWRLSFVLWARDDRPVAYAILSRKGERDAHIHHFMVAPEWRNHGFGELMLAEAEQRARETGCRRMTLKVPKENTAARRFYERHGFRPGREEPESGYWTLQKTLGLVVAVHQPNYLPWLGYFHKMAAADAFVFLDDAQFSKNSYINRVRVLGPAGPRWLTLPVSVHLGQAINEVRPARPDWASRHLDTLYGCYRPARGFDETWPLVAKLLEGAPAPNLAAINRFLIEGLAKALGIDIQLYASSQLRVSGRGDERLIGLVRAVDPQGIYLSGRGGAKYQAPEKFRQAGLGFRYTGFRHPAYDQGRAPFVEGLSVVDALFHLGVEETGRLVRESASAAPARGGA